MQEDPAGQCLGWSKGLFLLSQNFLTAVGHIIPGLTVEAGWFSFGFDIGLATSFSSIECLQSQDGIPTHDLDQSVQREMFAELNLSPQVILLKVDNSRKERLRKCSSSVWLQMLLSSHPYKELWSPPPHTHTYSTGTPFPAAEYVSFTV